MNSEVMEIDLSLRDAFAAVLKFLLFSFKGGSLKSMAFLWFYFFRCLMSFQSLGFQLELKGRGVLTAI